MTMIQNISFLAEPLTDAALNCLWQGGILVFFSWCILRPAIRISAATRFLLWWGVLAAICGLFVFDLIRATKPAGPVSNLAPVPESRAALKMPIIGGSVLTTLSGPLVSPPGSTKQAATHGKPRPDGRLILRWPKAISRWGGLLLGAWALIFFGLMARLIWSFGHLLKLKRSFTPLSQELSDRVCALFARQGLDRSISIGLSKEISMPVAVGLFNSMILIPENLPGLLSAQEFEQVILHEAAHLQRKDDWWNLAQQVCKAFFFFNPSVLIVSRQLEIVREAACDDLVIGATRDPRGYALCLTKLLEATTVSRHQLLASGAWFSMSQLSQRIDRLLSGEERMPSQMSKSAVVLGFTILIVFAAVCAIESPLTTFAAESVPAVKSVPAVTSARPPASPAFEDEKPPAQTEREWMLEELNLLRQELKTLSESAPSNPEAIFRTKREILTLRRQLAQYDIKHPDRKLPPDASPRESQRAEALKTQIINSLLAVLKNDPDQNVKSTALQSITSLNSDLIIKPLEEFIVRDTNTQIRSTAVSIISDRANEASADSLLRLYDKVNDPQLKQRILESLRLLQTNQFGQKVLVVPAAAIPKLESIAKDEGIPGLRSAALRILGQAAIQPDTSESGGGSALEVQNQKGGQAFFTGQVRNGIVDLKAGSTTTLYEALVQVGWTEFADLAKVKINRIDPASKVPKDILVNLKEIIKQGKRDKDPVLRDGDRVNVPEKGIAF